MNKAVVDSYEKYMRLPGTTGKAAAVAHTQCGSCWNGRARSLLRDTGLYNHGLQRAQLRNCSPVPPWCMHVLSRLKVSPWVPGIVRKDAHTREELHSLAVHHMEQWYSTSHIWGFADGSVTGTRSGAGAAIFARGCDDPDFEWGGSAGRHSSPYVAEMKALAVCLNHMLRGCDPCVATVFTDSQSLLMALRAGPRRAAETLFCVLWQQILQLCTRGFELTLQYVPSHVGIRGNEYVDDLAKRGLSVIHVDPLSLRGAMTYMRNRLDEQEVKPSSSTLYWTRGKAPTLRVPPKTQGKLTRAGDTVIRQLRCGRHRLIYDFLQPDHKATCVLCGLPSSLKHLFVCEEAALTNLRLLHPRDLLFTRREDVIVHLLESGFIDDEVTYLVQSEA